MSQPPPPQEIATGIVRSYGRLNRIPNHSVEVGETAPVDWNWSVAGAYWVEQPHVGFKSLCLDVSDSTADWRSDAFQVIAGETYILQAWAKGEAVSGEFFVTVRWWRDLAATDFISEDNIPIPLGSYVDWTLFENAFTAPSEAVAADVQFRCPTPSTGKVYADDFALLTEWLPQYRITIEAITYPFEVTLNPVEIYAHATTYFLESIQFYPITVRLTVKPVATAYVEVFDADHERFLLPRTEITSETGFDINWDGGGVFEPRIVGAIESLTIDFPVEKPKKIEPVEMGTDTSWIYSLLAFLVGLASGFGGGYSVGRKKKTGRVVKA